MTKEGTLGKATGKEKNKVEGFCRSPAAISKEDLIIPYLLVRTSMWLRSLAILSASLSICFLGRSAISRIFCLL